VLNQQTELMARERVASLRCEAASRPTFEPVEAQSPTKSRSGPRRVSCQRDRVHRGAVGVEERAELVCVSAAAGREERGS